MKSLTFKILDQIPTEQIYRYLEQKNASKKQPGSSNVGITAASRKAQTKSAIDSLTRDLAK